MPNSMQADSPIESVNKTLNKHLDKIMYVCESQLSNIAMAASIVIETEIKVQNATTNDESPRTIGMKKLFITTGAIDDTTEIKRDILAPSFLQDADEDTVIDVEVKKPKFTHIDEWLDTPQRDEGASYAQFFLDWCRLPAWKKYAYSQFMWGNKLFCTYLGKRYRVTGASRLGDVWLTSKFDQREGYELRVNVDDITEWSKEP